MGIKSMCAVWWVQYRGISAKSKLEVVGAHGCVRHWVRAMGVQVQLGFRCDGGSGAMGVQVCVQVQCDICASWGARWDIGWIQV